MRRALLLLLPMLASCKHDPAPRPRDTGVHSTKVHGTEVQDGAVRDTREARDAPDEALRDVPADAAAVKLEKVAAGLDRPVLVTFAPGDPRKRLFVLEQHVGRIRVIEGGKLAAKSFLDLKGKVSTENEQGLLALAFAPDFATSHRLFVYFTDAKGDSRLVEYQTAAADSDAVDVSTRRELLFVDQPYSNHNGGHLAFGPDGKLYLGLGDGGAGGDPHGNGQNDDSLLAKLLRFDVGAARPEPEIVAKGLRNPWRYDFDPATGDLYIGDVGQDAWEQLYAVAAGSVDGRNFGWNVAEGRHCYDRDTCDRSAFTAPVTDYPHDQGCSVTGGVVYRGKAIPALDGVYFYGDFCLGWIHSFRWSADGIRAHWDWRPVLDPDAQITQLSSFGRDEDGEIYVISLDGTIWKLVPAS
jgi:glucose/arabinose dehydrogenase